MQVSWRHVDRAANARGQASGEPCSQGAVASLPRREGAEAAAAAADIRMELIGAERDHIYRMLQEGQITDEARRRLERELDLEEASIALNREEGLGPPL